MTPRRLIISFRTRAPSKACEAVIELVGAPPTVDSYEGTRHVMEWHDEWPTLARVLVGDAYREGRLPDITDLTMEVERPVPR